MVGQYIDMHVVWTKCLGVLKYIHSTLINQSQIGSEFRNIKILDQSKCFGLFYRPI